MAGWLEKKLNLKNLMQKIKFNWWWWQKWRLAGKQIPKISTKCSNEMLCILRNEIFARLVHLHFAKMYDILAFIIWISRRGRNRTTSEIFQHFYSFGKSRYSTYIYFLEEMELKLLKGKILSDYIPMIIIRNRLLYHSSEIRSLCLMYLIIFFITLFFPY